MSLVKPQREFDEIALADFRMVMAGIRKIADSDTACWLWPKSWPDAWGEKPTRFSISRDGQGYGQFSLPATVDYRARSFIAHRLAYQHFNILLDRTFVDPSFEGEWAGGSIGKSNHVRHSSSCPHCCVNASHFQIGSHAHNMLDRAVKDHAKDELPPEARARSKEVVATFQGGTYDIRELRKQLAMPDWQIVRIIADAGLNSEILFHSFDKKTGKV